MLAHVASDVHPQEIKVVQDPFVPLHVLGGTIARFHFCLLAEVGAHTSIPGMFPSPPRPAEA